MRLLSTEKTGESVLPRNRIGSVINEPADSKPEPGTA